MALNYFMTIYITSNRSLLSRFDNRLDILNEYLVNLCCMHLLCFTDEVPIETQFTYGWSLVCVSCFLCGVNLLIVFYSWANFIRLVVLKLYNFLSRKKSEEANPVEATIAPIQIQED